MVSLTVENYLKAAFQITTNSAKDWVSTGELAQELEVSPGSVTSMLKTLAESKLVEYRPYEGAQLTASGKRLALRMIRRHRLIELFLVETLKLPWDLVHEEAEHMEHAVSDYLVDRIDEYLGHPEADPHGDPIPSSEGDLRGDENVSVPLSECPAGTKVKFVRVTNQDADFLRYLSESGFHLGETGVVESNNAEAGIVSTKSTGTTLTIGHKAAESLLVEKIT